MQIMKVADAAHAAMLERVPEAVARTMDAIEELRCALASQEALARLTSTSTGVPILINLPMVGTVGAFTLHVDPEAISIAMACHLALAGQLTPGAPGAQVIPFPREER